jgi:uncharacterized delta-60 repeat protein
MRRHGRQSFCIALSCLGFVLLTATIGWAKAGDLDRSFSKDGKVVTSFPSSGSEAFAVAVQSNGKIVAVGVTGDDEPKMRFALARYNANGSLDRTFSRDGKVMTDLTTGNDVAFAVALLPNGKIVAAGRGRGIGGRFALARYRSTGVLDTTFNHDGKVLTNFSDAEDVAFGVAVQADNKIVAGGTAGGSGGRVALARYTRDGSLDVSFGGDGKLGTNFSPGRDGAHRESDRCRPTHLHPSSPTGRDLASSLAMPTVRPALASRVVPFGGWPDARAELDFGVSLDSRSVRDRSEQPSVHRRVHGRGVHAGRRVGSLSAAEMTAHRRPHVGS